MPDEMRQMLEEIEKQKAAKAASGGTQAPSEASRYGGHGVEQFRGTAAARRTLRRPARRRRRRPM